MIVSNRGREAGMLGWDFIEAMRAARESAAPAHGGRNDIDVAAVNRGVRRW
jgi:hypothetical protein